MNKHCILMFGLGISEYFLCTLWSEWVTLHQAGKSFSLTFEKRQQSSTGDSVSLPCPSSNHIFSHHTACHIFTILPGLELVELQEIAYFLCTLMSTLLLHKQMYSCTLIKPCNHWWQGNETFYFLYCHLDKHLITTQTQSKFHLRQKGQTEICVNGV